MSAATRTRTIDPRRVVLALGAALLAMGAAAAVTATSAFRTDDGLLATAITLPIARLER